VPPEKFAAAAHSIFDDDEGRMGGYTDIDMAKEILAPGYDWRLETSAERIKNVPILLLSAKYDTPDCQGTELVAALGRLHPADVTTISMDTDHAFSDHRIALEKEILNWLQPRPPRLQPAQILVERSANSESIQKTSEVGAPFCCATAG
jgi:hypothetical protein